MRVLPRASLLRIVIMGLSLSTRQRKKQFFFEKKNQKTFIHEVGGWGSTRQNVQKFFASFFQKRRSFFYGSISN
jgi:hypothetical protein